jgi:hypothetical protein
MDRGDRWDLAFQSRKLGIDITDSSLLTETNSYLFSQRWAIS